LPIVIVNGAGIMAAKKAAVPLKNAAALRSAPKPTDARKRKNGPQRTENANGKRNGMPGVTREQIAAAKSVDLLAYMQAAEPRELKKTGPNEYRTASHGSLVISNGKWVWNRGNTGGRSALDYLIKVRGMGFVAAVETVLGSHAAPSPFPLPVKGPEPSLPRNLRLPRRAGIPSNAVKYLQRRGIHSDIISRCLKSGIFYEGVYENPREPELYGAAACVFVGRDEHGKARFATLRGVSMDFKRDARGSDKLYNFTLPAVYPDHPAVAVFESPVDLLSHATLAQRGELAFEGHRLSLGGTAGVALMAYLERNPQINRVSLCLDNDDAGRAAAKKILNTLGADERYKGIAVTAEPPKEGKDYNDFLLHLLKQEKEQQKDGPRREAVYSL
jgi:hypothetical protein